MIWYRHWLELRYRLLGAAAVALLIHLFFPFGVHGSTNFFRETGKFGSEIGGAEPLIGAMGGAERLIAWGVHVQLSIITLTFAALLFSRQRERHGIDAYSRTLPISRFDLDATRLAAGFAGVSAIAFGTCFIDIVFLLLTGHPVPLIAMLRASLTGTMLLLPLVAALSMAAISSWSAVLVTVAWPLVFFWGSSGVRSLMFDPDRAAFAAMLAIPATVVLFIAASRLRQWKEL